LSKITALVPPSTVLGTEWIRRRFIGGANGRATNHKKSGGNQMEINDKFSMKENYIQREKSLRSDYVEHHID